MWAQGADGRALERVEAGDLKAWINDDPVEVRSLERPGDPLILLVVLDTVGDLNSIDAARATIEARINQMPDSWYVALLEAQDGFRVVLDPTQNRRKLVEELQNSSVSGFPGLLGAVEPAAEIASSMLRKSGVRAAVLFVTDGGIEDYRGDFTSPVVNPSDSGDLSRRFRDRIVQEEMAKLVAAVGSRPAPLFFAHLDERSDTLNVAYQNGIRQFALETAGEALFARSVADVAGQVERLLDRVAASYAVTLGAQGEFQSPLTIRIETSEPGVELRYRQSLAVERVKGKKGKKKR